MNKLYILTGPAGVGKSTVSRRIAENLDKSVLIEGDDIYNLFVGGRISPWKENAPLELFWDNIYTLIDSYLKNGYDVVFNYIIKKNRLVQLKDKFRKYSIKFTCLLVDENTLLKRDKMRPIDSQMGERCIKLLNDFKNENYADRYIINTTDLVVDDIVNEIIHDRKFIIPRMSLNRIKTPEDILEYMKDNIKYGWLDINNNKHIGNMKGFRKLYRTSSLEEILKNKMGTCIEQVWLMKQLLDKLQIKSKMFCTRIYEGRDFNNLEDEEHMHCFILYYLNNRVYQIEHPNWERVGIYEYKNEKTALTKINNYYINLSDGKARPITEFYEVKKDLSFKEFNLYINSLYTTSDNSLYLMVPTLDDLKYRQKLMEDPETMDYNRGYNVNIQGYDYMTGCIKFPKDNWDEWYQRYLDDPKRYYAYIVRKSDNLKVGYVNFHWNNNDSRYDCGVVIEKIHRNNGYSEKALRLLSNVAFTKYNVDCLWDDIPEDRVYARKSFSKVGFVSSNQIYTVKKFNEDEIINSMILTKDEYFKKQEMGVIK